MSNPGSLTQRSKAELVALARRKGIRGPEAMTKEALIRALSRLQKVDKTTKPAVKTSAATKASKSVKAASRVVATKTATKPVRVAKKSAVSLTPSVEVNGEATTAAPARNTAAADKPADQSATTSLDTAPTTTPGEAETTPAPTDSTLPKPAVRPLIRPLSAYRDPAAAARSSSAPKDRVYLAVNDPYWLHVMWDLSAQSIQRAEAALKQDWYGAKLILRLYDVTSQDTTSTSETHLRDEVVAPDSRNWYIQVPQPPRQYRVDVGYLSRRGDFFPLAKSNVVMPPKAGTAEALDIGWEKDPKKAERILAMSTGFESAVHPDLKEVFEERYGRSFGPPKESAFGSGATPPGQMKKFFFEIDAKLIVFGRTDPNAHVTLGNDPLDLSPNGTFVMEFSLPDSRQIIPAVATSPDGMEERTIVLAVERNTKYLDPMIHDQMSES